MSLRLRRIAVRVMPGVDEPFSAPFERSVTLVRGDNESGKSTLRRALDAVLWGAGAETARVVAQFDRSGTPITATVNHAATVWADAVGTAIAEPALPAGHLRGSLSFGIEDLARADDATALAAEITRDMYGGLDLDRLVGELPTTRYAKGARDELSTARSRRLEIERASREIENARGGLADLEKRQAQGSAAAVRLGQLEMVRAFHADQAALAQLRDEAAELPETVTRMDGGELDAVMQLRELVAGSAARESALLDAIAEAERVDGQAGLGAVLPSRPDESVIETHLGDLAGAEQSLREAQQAEAGARRGMVAVGDLLVELGVLGAADSDVSVDLDGVRVDHVAELVTRRTRVAAEIARIDADVERLEKRLEPDADDPLTGGDPGEGTVLLTRWLGAAAGLAAEGVATGSAGRVLAFVVGCIAVLQAVVMLAVGHALVGVCFAAVFAVSGLVGWRPSSRRRAQPVPVTDAAGLARAQYAELGLPDPEQWTPAAVTALRRSLSQLDVARRVREADRHQLERERVARTPLDGELVRIDDELGELRVRLGRQVDGPAQLTRIVGHLVDLSSAHVAVETAAGVVAAARGDVDAALVRVNDWLARFGVTTRAVDLTTARELHTDLLERALDAKAARNELAARTAELAALREEVGGSDEAQRLIFVRCDVPLGDLDALGRRVDEHALFARLGGQVLAHDAALASMRRRFTGDDELLSLSAEALERAIGAAEAQHEDVDALNRQIGKIQQQVLDAERGSGLDAADEAVAGALGALESACASALVRAAVHAVVDAVRDEFDARQRPAVLRRAQELFARFTHDRYDLLSARDGGAHVLRARSVTTGEVLDLAELSTGTRMQLLLAARLGFALESPGTDNAPLVFDETLVSSDPSRTRAIVESLASVARDAGRQIVYLTSDPADEAIFRDVFADDPELLGVVDLDAERGRARAGRSLGSGAAPAPRVVPAPNGDGPDGYAAAIGAAPWDPRRLATDAHVIHLLWDDLDAVHSLEISRHRLVGQAMRALGGHGIAGVRPELAGTLGARLVVAQALGAAWRQGRGVSLTRAVIEQAGLTPAMRDRVLELAIASDMDAECLWSAVADGAIRNFRGDQKDKLHDALVEAGCLTDVEPLDRDELARRAFEAAAPLVESGALGVDEVDQLVERLQRVDGARDDG